MAEKAGSDTRWLDFLRWDQQTVLDVLFVLVLPIVCLLFDPGIIAAGPLAPEMAQRILWPGLLSAFQLPLYFLFAFTTLSFWLSFLPNFPDSLKDTLRGIVFLGVILSGLFIALMLPLAVLAVALVPLLAPFGIAPLLTAWRYYWRHLDMGEQKAWRVRHRTGFITGIIAPVVAAAIVHVGEYAMIDKYFENLRSDDSALVGESIRSLASHPLCLSNCKAGVVWMYCHDQLAISSDKFVELFADQSLGKVFADGNCGMLED